MTISTSEGTLKKIINFLAISDFLDFFSKIALAKRISLKNRRMWISKLNNFHHNFSKRFLLLVIRPPPFVCSNPFLNLPHLSLPFALFYNDYKSS